MSSQRFAVTEAGKIEALPHKQAHNHRTPYHTDYDRVVFAHSFRRLGRKTQVHPLADDDHTHNRLTHSVEVASVGRSLGNIVGEMLREQDHLPPNISPNDVATTVQTACLAHDIGNPPFGHTGEDALREWFRKPEHASFLQPLTTEQRNDVQTYEGNAHSLRQTASLEMYRDQGGMRLTAAAYGTLLKYPWTSSDEQGRKKFNIYQTELPLMRQIAQELGLPEKSPNHWVRHPLSYLMEAADDICYALMDLEDAVSLNLLHPQEVARIFVPLMGDSEELYLSSPFATSANMQHISSTIARMRGMAIGKAIDAVAATFMKHHADLLRGEFAGKDLVEQCQPDVRDSLLEAKKLARDRVFRHRSKLVREIASFSCINMVLDLLVPAAYEWIVLGKSKESLSMRHQLSLDLLKSTDAIEASDSPYTAYMKILDFVGGMTDNYAARTARELSGLSMV